MKKAMLAASLALLLALPACKGGTPTIISPASTPSPTPAPASTPAPPARPGAVWEELRYDHTFTAGDGAIIMVVTYAFPRLEENGHPAAGAVNRYYEEQKSEFLAAAGEAAQWGNAEYEIAVQSGFTYTPFVEEISFEITRESADYVSVRREVYANHGGPHPTVYVFSEQFSLEDGSRLSFADFFLDPGAAADQVLAAIAASPAIADNGLEEAARQSFSAEQFYVTDEGFVFWYQAGDLPAQNSPLEIAIPYEDLAGLAALW